MANSVNQEQTASRNCSSTDRLLQTVQTQSRLLLEEQFNQGLHCLPFHLHLYDKFTIKGLYLNLRAMTAIILGVLNTCEQRHEKTNILVSDLVGHKPGCTATEDG